MLMVREWYMHPNGQIPAYEWALDDVNPPVHAWAAWRVYKIEKKRRGSRGPKVSGTRLPQAASQFHLVGEPQRRRRPQRVSRRIPGPGQYWRLRPQRAAPHGRTHRAGRRYRLDGHVLPELLAIALELAHDDPAYEDVASKFWEHFLYIATAINSLRQQLQLHVGAKQDGFFYDVLDMPERLARPDASPVMVGLVPLFAVETLEPEIVDAFPGFERRLEWFINNRPDLTHNVACMQTQGRRRAAPAFHRGCRSASARASIHAGRIGVSVAVRHSIALAPLTG